MAVNTAKEVFDTHLPARLQAKKDTLAKINAKYKFVLNGDGGGTWVVDLTTPGGSVTAGEGQANCTITMAAKDFVDLINGKLNGQMAFMTGKLKVAGDMGLAMKLQQVLG
ncbi:MAG: SCP2 sterol-binding domain-containing protein [Deltaproteobacteria bacterium]|nr:SCP2 sterol-binding domain-containing protein [Deltaproteobacteria bacterium]